MQIFGSLGLGTIQLELAGAGDAADAGVSRVVGGGSAYVPVGGLISQGDTVAATTTNEDRSLGFWVKIFWEVFAVAACPAFSN